MTRADAASTATRRWSTRSTSQGFHGIEVLKGIDLEVHAGRGRLPARARPAPARRRSCAASTSSRPSTAAGIWVDGDLMGYAERGGSCTGSPTRRSPPSAARSAWSSSGSTCSRTRPRWRTSCEAPIQVNGREASRPRATRAVELLERVGLADKRDAYPGAALRRPAAAGRDRPGAGDGPQADALRRAHLARSTPSWSARCST